MAEVSGRKFSESEVVKCSPLRVEVDSPEIQISEDLHQWAAIYSLDAFSDAKSSRDMRIEDSSVENQDLDSSSLRKKESRRRPGPLLPIFVLGIKWIKGKFTTTILKIQNFLKYGGDCIVWALQNFGDLFYTFGTANRSSFPCYTAAADTSSQYSSIENLPNHIIELILQDLPLPDYLAFPSVCHQWLDVQLDNRSRIPKFRPRIVPWLVPNLHQITPCYSDFQNGRIYHLQIPENVRGKQRLFSSNGWLLLLGHPVRAWARGSCWEVSLFNPVTQQIIHLPNLTYDEHEPLRHGCMSPNPMAREYAVVIVSIEYVYLWRQGDPEWIMFYIYPETFITSVFAKRNQVFYLKPPKSGDLYIIDPTIPDPILDRIIMGNCTRSPPHRTSQFLVEVDDEICLVEAIFGVGCRVFKAEMVDRSWDRVGSVGGVTIFMSRSASFSLPYSCARSQPDSVYLPKQLTFAEWFTRSEIDQCIVYMSHALPSMGRRTSFLPHTASGDDRFVFLKSELLWLLPTISNEE